MGAVVLAVGLLASSVSFALTPEEEATSTRLMKEGIAARDRGDLVSAERAFRAAHGIANLPSSGYALASVLARRGTVVEALTIARAIQRMTPAPTWTSASTDAYRLAGALAADIERRVASVTIDVTDADESSTRVDLDSQPLKPPVLGVARMIDPGHHELRVTRAGFAVKTEALDLREGEQRRLVVTLAPSATRGSTPAAPPADPDEEELEVRPLLITGIVALGLGVGAVGAGFAMGAASRSKEDEIAGKCPNDKCPSSVFPQLDDAESYATAANILFIAGGVVAAGGATLIVVDLVSDEEAEPAAPNARLRIRPSGLDVSGRF